MDVLILLLGGNPLPNYVVADYLLKPDRKDVGDLPVPGKIIFVSTKRSVGFCEPIQLLLGAKRPGNDCEFLEIKLEDNHRVPQTIQTEIKRTLNGLKKEGLSSIHLHYSGGTKPMAVNSLIAVEEFSNGTKLILSDLDPEEHKLKVLTGDLKNEADRYPDSLDLRYFVKLSVREILTLHCMDDSKDKKIGKDLVFEKDVLDVEAFVKEIVPLYKKRTGHKIFTQCREKLKKGEDISSILKSLESIEITPEQTKKLNKFLNGTWLEDFVLKTLRDLKENGHIDVDDIRKGVYASYNERLLEIDAIVMKGYQMYLISCTTSQKIKLVKHKAFEALYRAEQLGGLQAKVFVVSTMFNCKEEAHQFTRKSNIDELTKDLEQFEAKEKCFPTGLDELSEQKENEGSLARIFMSNII